MKLIERIQGAWEVIRRFDELDAVMRQIETLGAILERLKGIEERLAIHPTLLQLAERIEVLDATVRKVENLEIPKTLVVVQSSGKESHPVQDQLYEWHRLQLLSKFVQLAGKAKEIELEWQRIQQDEHDFLFAFQVSNGEDSQAKYMYKKGIADGVKWCVNRFS